jgi:hypothetical protein
MTTTRYKELLEFLYSNSPEDTLHDCSFRILCFSYENGKLKDWIRFEQNSGDPSWKTLLVFPTIGMKFDYTRKIKNVIRFIERASCE